MSVQAIVCAMAVQEISPAEKLLLLAMANYADEHMECWPSQERLAADTCLSDRHVRRILVMLEARRMVSRRPRRRPDGYRASDVITLHFAGQVSPISPDTVSPDIMSPDIQVDLTGQIVPILPDTVSAPTTLEPSTEPSMEPSGRAGAREPAVCRPKADAPKPKGSRRCPAEYAPSEAIRQLAAAEGFQPGELERELAKFRDHQFRDAHSDWNAAFRNWLRRAAESRPKNGSNPKFTAKQENLDRAFRAAQALPADRGLR